MAVRNLLDRYTIKVKVKCTLLQALRLCTGRTAHRGSRGIALQLQWSRGSVLAFGTQVRGFTPDRSRRIFRAKKILCTSSFGGDVKPSVVALQHVKDS